jgi:hypothetical protein
MAIPAPEVRSSGRVNSAAFTVPPDRGGVTHIMWCGLLWFRIGPSDGLLYVHMVMKFGVPSETGISRSASLCF